ncbi:hypothetical protein AVEN_156750-1, partial [Araneus ventricosus]
MTSMGKDSMKKKNHFEKVADRKCGTVAVYTADIRQVNSKRYSATPLSAANGYPKWLQNVFSA